MRIVAGGIDIGRGSGRNRHSNEVNLGRGMDTRFVFAALAGAFGAGFIFAAITVVRHVAY